jgi:anti-sigma B factor antagonist
MTTSTHSVDEPTVELRRLRPDTALIVLGGEHDLATAPRLQESVDQALASCGNLIVDVSEATFVDSSTIATFVRAKDRAERSGGRFNLVLGTAAIVERALEVSGVISLLRVVPSVEQALDDV